jgi:flagellin
LTQQINTADQGIRNLNDGISIVQTAEGALSQVSEMAQRILALSVQGQTSALTTAQKQSITTEMRSLLNGIDAIETRTKFGSNTSSLFSSAALTVYSSKESADSVSITTTALATIGTTTGGLAVTLSANVTTAAIAASVGDFQAIVTSVSTFINAISTQRGVLGATQNQMEYSINNIIELSANLSSARSRVVDTDYAAETAKLTKGQILQQAATAMLAQANQMPNVILSLLK